MGCRPPVGGVLLEAWGRRCGALDSLGPLLPPAPGASTRLALACSSELQGVLWPRQASPPGCCVAEVVLALSDGVPGSLTLKSTLSGTPQKKEPEEGAGKRAELGGCHLVPNTGWSTASQTGHTLGPLGALRNTHAPWDHTPGDSDLMVWVAWAARLFQSSQSDL